MPPLDRLPVVQGRLPDGVERVPTKRVTVTMPVALLEEIDEIRGDRNRADVVREALRDWVTEASS